MSQKMDFDAIVIGGGFGGLYAVKKLRDELELKVQAFDKATDVAGTWYWNRYPGALSDTETHLYCYSWDKELLQSLEIKKNMCKALMYASIYSKWLKSMI